MPEPPGKRLVSLVQLPDGRWASHNERDISDLTEQDFLGAIHAFTLWANLLVTRRGWLGHDAEERT